MLHRLTCLCASLCGRFSIICVKQHSAGNRTCRMAFALLLVPLFVVPSFALSDIEIEATQTVGGSGVYAYWSLDEMGDETYTFFDDFASFQVLKMDGESYVFRQENPTEIAATGYVNYVGGDFFEVQFHVGEGDLQVTNAEHRGARIIQAETTAPDAYYTNFSPNEPVNWQFIVDGEVVDSLTGGTSIIPAGEFTYDGPIQDYFGYRMILTVDEPRRNALWSARPYFYGAWTYQVQEYVFNGKVEVGDQLNVVIGHLDNIDNNVEIIKESVINIEETTVTISNNINQSTTAIIDVSNQLQNSNSNIWNAFGEKVESLVVSSEQEMQTAIDGFNSKVKTKLGGLYDAYEIADNSINNFVSAFGVSTADSGYGFNFPGLSFPMNGTQITILPAQTVYIENAAFTVFSNLLGNLVAFLCALAAFHISEDALICFLSGVSYWGFIRGRHDR